MIPALNEEEGIGKVLDSMPNPVVSDIIVVDNGSTDKTAQVAERKGAIVVKEPKKGYGSAYKTGFKNLPKNTDIVACLDADMSYPAARIEDIADILKKEKIDFISCSRVTDGAMSLKHKFGNKVLNFFTNSLFGVRMKDAQSGMWVFRKSILGKVKPESDGMSFSEEIKLRAIMEGFKFKEIDIPYSKRIGKAKIRSFRDGMSMLAHLFRMKMDF